MNDRTPEQIKDDNDTRLRRAEAWIARAKAVEDDTSQFIFYWVAFNALYSRRETGFEEDKPEKEMMKAFLRDVCEKREPKINTILDKNGAVIRTLLGVPQSYEGFWRKDFSHQNKNIRTLQDWLEEFAYQRLPAKGAKCRLEQIFLRLYVARNQVFHGSHSGDTDSQGRTQVEKGAEILSFFIPAFCGIMKNVSKDWGPVCFRRQGEADDPKCPPPWLPGTE